MDYLFEISNAKPRGEETPITYVVLEPLRCDLRIRSSPHSAQYRKSLISSTATPVGLFAPVIITCAFLIPARYGNL